MIWRLVRRDLGMMVWTTIAVVACWYGLSHIPGTTMWEAAVGAGIYILPRMQERATLFDAGLPIAVKDLFLARMISVFAVWWLIMGSCAVLTSVLAIRKSDPAQILAMGAGIMALFLAAQSVRVRAATGPTWSLIATAILAPFIAFLTPLLPFVWVLAVSALLSVAFFIFVWTHLPLAYELVPPRPASAPWLDISLVPKRFVWTPIVRSLCPLPLIVYLIPIAIVSTMWRWGSLFCIFSVIVATWQLSWASSLPVRRSVLLAIILLPALATGLAGFFLNTPLTRTPIILKWSRDGRVTEILPPLEFWALGTAKPASAPWGETWLPRQERLRGMPVYNPYSFGPGSSVRFSDWQTGRLVQEMNFDPFDPKSKGLSRVFARRIKRPVRFTLLYAATFTIWLLLIANALFAAMSWHIRIHSGADWITSALIFALLAFSLYLAWPAHSVAFNPTTASFMDALAFRTSAMLPSNLALAALVAFAPAALLWWTALRLFAGIETPPANDPAWYR